MATNVIQAKLELVDNNFASKLRDDENALKRFENAAQSAGANFKESFVSGLAGGLSVEVFHQLEEVATEAFHKMIEVASELGHALRDAGNEVQDLTNLSEKTGVSAQVLEGLALRFKESRVEVSSLNVAMRYLNRRIAEGDQVLKSLGITTTDTWEAFLQLSEIFHNAPKSADKSTVAIKALGRAGTELIPVMNLGREAMERFIESAEQTGTVFSPQQQENLKKLQAEFYRTDRAVRALHISIVGGLAPGFLKLEQAIVGHALTAIEEFARRIATISLIFASLPGVGPFFKQIVVEMGKLFKETEKFREILQPPADLIGPEIPAEIEANLEKMRAAREALARAAREQKEAQRSLQQLLSDIQRNTLAAGPEEFLNKRTVGTVDPLAGKFEKLKEIPLLFSPGVEAMQKFRAQLEELGDRSLVQANILTEALGTLLGGLQSFFEAVLTDFRQIGNVIVSTVRSIIAQVLAEFAKLAIVNFLKTFIGGFGIPGFGFVGSQLLGGVAGTDSASGIVGTNSSGVMAGLTRAVNDLTRTLRTDEAVRVDRESFVDTVGNAISEQDRRRAMATGF